MEPNPENFTEYDPETDWPVFNEDQALNIPGPQRAKPIKPDPGCFGEGPGPLKTNVGKIMLNTSSFETYAQVYEIVLILSKDERRAVTKLEIDVSSAPALMVNIECINEEDMCFPSYKGLFVNPTNRLGLMGNCLDECEGELTYLWSVKALNNDGTTKDLKYV